jgi:hypothetical protein
MSVFLALATTAIEPDFELELKDEEEEDPNPEELMPPIPEELMPPPLMA